MAQLNFGPLQQLQQQIAQPQVTPISAFQGARDQRRQRSLADMQLQQNKFKLDELGRQKKMQDAYSQLGDPSTADAAAEYIRNNMSIDDQVRLRQLADLEMKEKVTRMSAEPDPMKRGEIWTNSSNPLLRHEISKTYDGKGVPDDDQYRLEVATGIRTPKADYTLGDKRYSGATNTPIATNTQTPSGVREIEHIMALDPADPVRQAWIAKNAKQPSVFEQKYNAAMALQTRGKPPERVTDEDRLAALEFAAGNMSFEYEDGKGFRLDTGGKLTVGATGAIQKRLSDLNVAMSVLNEYAKDVDTAIDSGAIKHWNVGDLGVAADRLGSFINQASGINVDALTPAARTELETTGSGLLGTIGRALLDQRLSDTDIEIVQGMIGQLEKGNMTLDKIPTKVEAVIEIVNRTRTSLSRDLAEGVQRKLNSGATLDDLTLDEKLALREVLRAQQQGQ